MLLKDKVALITGSATGLGRGFAIAFAKEGAKIIINTSNLLVLLNLSSLNKPLIPIINNINGNSPER